MKNTDYSLSYLNIIDLRNQMIKKIEDGVVSLEICLVLYDSFAVDLLVRQFNNFCHQKIANKQYEARTAVRYRNEPILLLMSISGRFFIDNN